MYATRRPETGENTIKVACPKPRNKQLNDALLSRRGGRMKTKKDQPRSKEKQELRRSIDAES